MASRVANERKAILALREVGVLVEVVQWLFDDSDLDPDFFSCA